ncbi:MAG: TIGR02680 family protein [Ilumatobacteraceae bacterium]
MRWKPTRAGIFNVWEYDDQIFEFGDGRLVLRGRNGSGKSNALSLLFPFVLDGVMSAARMDPMGGGRSMKSLLLGRDDDDRAGRYRHDSGTGYVWMEFSDGHDFATLGVGASATQHRDAEPWFFVSSQRVGFDLELAENDTPLSRRQLGERFTDGTVFTTADDYRAAVDRRLFGLGPVRYRRLVDLLLTLRRPHLAGKLDTEHLSATLSAGLGELDSALIDDVAHSFDDLDAMQHELEGLATSLAAVEKFLPVFRDHLIGVGRERATAVTDAHSALRRVDHDRTAAAGELGTVREAVAGLAERAATALAEREQLDREIDTIQRSPAYQNAAALDEVRGSADRAENEAGKADARASAAQVEADQAGDAAGEANAAAERAEAELTEAVDEWNRTARAAGIESVLTAPDFDHDRAIAAATERRHQVAEVTALSDAAAKAADEAKRAEQQATDARERAESAARQLVAAEQETEHQRAELRSLRAAWAARATAVADDAVAVEPQIEIAPLDDLWGTPTGTSEDLVVTAQGEIEAFAHANQALNDFGTGVARTLDGAVAAAGAQKAVVDELRAERQRIATEPNPGPQPNPTRPDTGRADLAGAPLYVCADFADHVDEAARAGIEAALAASGMLDARVTPTAVADDALDAVLGTAGRAHPTGSTLADILVPVSVDGLGAERIAEVLHSIPLADDVVELHPDGRWRLGPVAGRFVQATQQFIGHAARERRRSERLAELDRRITTEQAVRVELRARVERLTAIHAAVDECRREQPPTTALSAALDALRTSTRVSAERAADLVAADTRAGELLAAADAASVKAHGAATRLRLPTTPTELGEVQARLRDCDAQLRIITGNTRSLAGARSVLQRETERAERLTQRAADETLSAAAAAAFARSERLRFEQLRENVGGDAERAVEALAAARGRRTKVDGDRENALAETKKAESTIGTLSERIAQLESRRAELAAALTEAERRFALICSSEIADVIGVDGVEPGAEARIAARRLLAGTQPPREDATNAMERAHREILLDGLRAGHDPSMPKLDGVDVIRVGTVDGDLPIGTLARQLRDEYERTGQLLTKQEREIFETHLLTRVGDSLRQLLLDADSFEHRINDEMAKVPTESGMVVELRWESDGDEPGLRDAIKALRTAPELLGPEQRESLREFFMQRIADLRSAEPGRSFAETLTAVLDYRAWHQFALYARFATGKRQRVTRAFYRGLSGGEAATLLHLPLFAAAAAQYSNGNVAGPRLIALDEAFVGIDDKMRARLMGLLTQLDVDVILTSHEFWGFYDTVPALVLYDLVRRPPTPGVYAQRFDWTADTTPGP